MTNTPCANHPEIAGENLCDGCDRFLCAQCLGLPTHGHQRLLHDHAQNRAGEVLFDRLAVDGDLALAALHPDARGGVLAAAGGIGAALGVELGLDGSGGSSLGAAGGGGDSRSHLWFGAITGDLRRQRQH